MSPHLFVGCPRDVGTRAPSPADACVPSGVALSPCPKDAECGLDDSCTLPEPAPILRVLHSFSMTTLDWDAGAHCEGLIPVNEEGEPSPERCQATTVTPASCRFFTVR